MCWGFIFLICKSKKLLIFSEGEEDIYLILPLFIPTFVSTLYQNKVPRAWVCICVFSTSTDWSNLKRASASLCLHMCHLFPNLPLGLECVVCSSTIGYFLCGLGFCGDFPIEGQRTWKQEECCHNYWERERERGLIHVWLIVFIYFSNYWAIILG